LLRYRDGLGVRSTRQIARAGERQLAVMAIVGSARPDFRTSSAVRKLHPAAWIDSGTDVRRLAQTAGPILRSVLATDGTKPAGNASRHQAPPTCCLPFGRRWLAGTGSWITPS